MINIFEFLYGSIGGWIFLFLLVFVIMASKKFALLFSWVFVAWGLVMIPSIMNLTLFGDLIPITLWGIESYISLYTLVCLVALILTVGFIKKVFGTNDHTWWLSFFVGFIFAGWIIYYHQDLYFAFVSILGGSEWIMILIFDIVLFAVPLYFIITWMKNNHVTTETVTEAVKNVAKSCLRFGDNGECIEWSSE